MRMVRELWEKPKKVRDTGADESPPLPTTADEVPHEPSFNPEFEPMADLASEFDQEFADPDAEPVTEQAHPETARFATPSPAPHAPPAADEDETAKRVDLFAERLSLVEKRMDGQEENLHRVLTMLVEWVENDVRSKENYVNAGRAA